MFQNLRSGNSFYILYKNEPRLAIGEVKSSPKPAPQFPYQYQPGVVAQPANMVEISVSIDSQDALFQKVPAELSITDYGPDMVISDNSDAMTNEIKALMHVSEKHVSDTPKHERNIAEYSSMLSVLNPQIAKETEQEKRIEQLTGELSEMKAMLTEILGRGSKKEK